VDFEQARVVSNPVALNRIVPVYPRSARRKGHEGCVTVELVVSEEGGVSTADVIATSGHAELDAAALAAVRTARFAPATEDGVCVSGQLRLTFDFKLK
jgi:protein TonB